MAGRRSDGEREVELRELLADVCELNRLVDYSARGAAEGVARWPDGRRWLWADAAGMVADLLALKELAAELEAKTRKVILDR